MKQFFKFVRLVIDRTFEKTMWFYHAAEFLLYLGSRKFPVIPHLAWLVLFLAVLFVSCYRVWNDQKAKADNLRAQLKDLKNEQPTFDISVGEVKRFTIKPFIDECKEEVEAAQRIVDANNAVKNMAGPEVFDDLMSSFSALPAMMRTETADEKLECLSSRLKKLEKYQDKIKQLYQIRLTISGSRSDANVEIWLECDAVVKMIVDDNYPQRHVPKPAVDYGYLVPPVVTNIAPQNKTWLASYADGKGAYSKIANLNAQRPLRVFDEDFYVIIDQPAIKIKAKITSQKRHSPQHMTLHVPLTDVPTEDIAPRKSRTHEEILEDLE